MDTAQRVSQSTEEDFLGSRHGWLREGASEQSMYVCSWIDTDKERERCVWGEKEKERESERERERERERGR